MSTSSNDVDEPVGCPITTGLSVPSWSGLGVGWLVDFCLSSNFWTQLLHPIMSQGNLRKQSRWFIYFFVNDFSSFHPNNFRDTISWECIAMNDGVRSRLIELQSFLLSKFDIDPTHRVLMFLPCFMRAPCKTRSFQVDRVRILVFVFHRILKQKEYCLSFAQILISRVNPELMMERKLIAHPTW